MGPMSRQGGAVDIRSAQKRAWQNKVAEGFNTTDIPLEFCLLQGETAERHSRQEPRRRRLARCRAD